VMATQIAVGKDVDSWCTRCNLILAHTVEAMVGSRITRVHCNTCGGQHAYRSSAPGRRPAGASGAVKRGGAGHKAGPRQSPAEEYAALLKGRDPTAARPYATSARFALGELLAHPVFGVGIVRASKDNNKIDVLFAAGQRTLLHGR